MQGLYNELTRRGAEMLWDDRSVSADVMSSGAGLFGVPPRAVASPKRLKNGAIEIASRGKSMQKKHPAGEAADFIYNFGQEGYVKFNNFRKD